MAQIIVAFALYGLLTAGNIQTITSLVLERKLSRQVLSVVQRVSALHE